MLPQVDNLDDVGKLEESVLISGVFLIFLSAGYFKCVATLPWLWWRR